MKKGLLIGCGSVIVLFLLLVSCVAIFSGADPQPSSTVDQKPAPAVPKPVEKPKEEKKVTLAKYNQLKNGMSYEQAVKIIGFEGTEMSQTELGGIKTIMYSWQNDDGSNMTAMFQNNKLNTKAQFGLK